MIVEFKAGRSPRKERLFRRRGCSETFAGCALWWPPARPITAVEKARRYLIWWITIIKYNLKARAVPATPFQFILSTEIASLER
jgi:hypothetical protein